MFMNVSTKTSYSFASTPSKIYQDTTIIIQNQFHMHTFTDTPRSLLKGFRRWLVTLVIMLTAMAMPMTKVLGQANINNLVFATNTNGSLEDLSSGSTVIMSGNNDDLGGTVTPIGFPFVFMGVAYTHFSANSNGQMTLHTSAGATAIASQQSSLGLGTVTLSPASGDNEVNNGIRIKVIGSAPNRKLVVEWNQFYFNFVNLTNAGNMQVWLNEGSGIITYMYGEIYNSSSTSVTSSIFLASSNTATTAGSITIGNPCTWAPSATLVSNTIAAGTGTTTGSPLVANIGSSSNTTRTFFRWTPTVTAPSDPTTLSFTAVTGVATTVNFVDNSTNEVGFAVIRATDAGLTQNVAVANVTSTTVATTGTAYTSVQSGLTPGITYYYKVIALNELGSSGLTGSQATTAAATYYYIGGASGDIATGSNWNTAADGSGTTRGTALTSDILIIDGQGSTPGSGTAVTLTLPAATSIGGLQITSGTAVTLTSSSTTTRTLTLTGSAGNTLDIPAGCSLIFSSTTNQAAIAFSTGSAMTGNISGTLTFSGAGTSNVLTTTGGTGTVVTVTSTGVVNLGIAANSLVGSAATLVIANGGTVNSTGATTGAPPVPLATWGATSNLNVSGLTTSTSAPTNNAQSFGNLTYNCPSSTATMSWFTSSTTGVIKGDLTITSTGTTGIFRATTTGTLTVNGNVIVNGGTLQSASSTGTLIVQGTTTIGASGKIDILAGTYSQRGTTFTNNGTLTGVASGSTLQFFSPTNVAQTFTGTGTVTTNVGAISVQNGGGLTISTTNQVPTLRVNLFIGTVTGSGKITIGTGAALATTVQIGATGLTTSGGSFDANPVMNLGTGTYTVLYQAETTPRTTGFEIPATRTITNTTIANTNGVTLAGGNLTISGTLTLTLGKLITSSSNIPTVTGTTTGAITGFSTSSYVSGPIARNLPASLVTGSTYVMPVGKGTYNPLELVNPTTNAGGIVTVQSEAFDANSGGTAGTLMGTLNTTRYWAASITAGSGNFTNTFIRLNDTRGTQDAIAASTTSNGTYNHIGGVTSTLTATSILNTTPAETTLQGFYLMGNVAAASLSSLAISPTGNLCTNVARTVTVTVTPGGAAITTVIISYQVNGGTAQTVAMTNLTGNGGLAADNWSGVIPVVSPTNGTVTWSVIATDGNGLIKSQTGTSYNDEPFFGKTLSVAVAPTTICPGGSATLTATLNGGSALKITEITQNYAGTGTNATPPSYLSFNVGSGNDLVELTNMGSFTASLNGYTIERWFSSTTAAEVIYTMPSGVTLAPGQTLVLAYGSGTNDLVNKVFYAGTPGFDIRSSGDQAGYIIKSGATVIDAVGVSGYSFPVATGVTAGDWSGSIPSMSGLAGSRLTSADNNTASSWTVASASNIINFGVLNSGLTAPAAYTVAWSTVPSSAFTASGASASTGVVTSSTVYTAVVTDPSTGCTLSPASNASLTVNTAPDAPSAINSTQCGAHVPTAQVITSGIGGGTGIFNWYAAATGGTALQSSNSATYTSSISTTTTFYVSESGVTGCESPRSPITVTVTTPDAVVASTNGPVCANAPLTLTATVTSNTNGNVYSYSWSAGNVAASGIATTTPGGTGTFGSPANIVVTPTAGGSYTYTVTATDATQGCTTTANIIATVNANPTVDSVRANPSAICQGSSSTLTAYSAITGPQTAPTYAAPGATDNTLGDNITLVQFNTINNITAAGGTSGYNNYIGTVAPTSVAAGSTYNLTVSVANGGTEYAGAWIDWDRSGTYTASEYISVPVSFTGAVWSATVAVTVPGGATPGVLGMRVRSRYNTAITSTDFNTAYSYGETEDYAINVVQVPSLTYTWDNGAGTGNPKIVTPASAGTITYNVTLLDGSGCSNTGSVVLTVNSVPGAPSTTSSEQCGNVVPTASVAGTGNPGAIFKWYDAATGGVLKQSSASTTYLGLVGTTTSFWVSEVSAAGCEGPRAQVDVTVNAPDVVTVTSSAGASVCAGGSFDLTSSYTPDFNNFATFTLTASPETGSGITNPVSLTGNATGSDAYTITPSAPGTYTYTVDAYDPDKGCHSLGTVTVTLYAYPTNVTAAASATTVCAGSSVNLTSTYDLPAVLYNEGFEITSPLPTGWAAQNNSIPVGTNDWLQGVPALATNGIFDAHTGTTASYIAGNFNNVSGANTISNWLFAPTVTMHNGDQFSFWTRVPTASGYADRLQVRMSTNGSSTNVGATAESLGDFTNLLIDINPTLVIQPTAGAYPETWTQYTATISGLSGPTSGRMAFRYYVLDGGTGANSNFVGIDDVVYNVPAPTTTFSWTSSPAGFTSTDQNPTNVTVSATTTYTVVASNLGGCTATANVTVTALPLPNAPLGTSSTQCGTKVPTATVATGGGGGNGTFNWYAAPTGGTALQSSTSATYNTSISTVGVTHFYVSEMGTNGCEGPRTDVTVTVTAPPTLSITATGSTTICQNGSVALSTAPGSDPSYVNFTWSAVPPTGAGLSSTTGASVTASPSASGSIVYTVTADDGVPVTGCSTSTNITVTVNPNPVITATATPGTICAGGTSILSGTSLGLATFNIGETSLGASFGANIGWGMYFNTTNAATINTVEIYPSTAGTLSVRLLDASSAVMDTKTFTLVAGDISTTVPKVLTLNFNVPAASTGWQIYYDGVNINRGTASYSYPYSDAGGFSITGNTLDGNNITGGSRYYFYNWNVTSITDITAAYNWQWSPGGALNQNPFNVTPGSTQNYTVTATDPGTGCSATSGTVTVTVAPVNGAPTATATTLCAGGSTTISANATGGGPFTYLWDDPAASTTASITVSPTTTTTYSVIVKDFCNNSTLPIPITITVNPLPTATIAEAGPITLCSPASQVLTAGTNAGSATYQWTLNGVNISGATAATYTVNTVSTGTYRVIVTNTATGCISAPSAGVVVTINPQPAAVTVTPATVTICAGDNTTLVASGGVSGGSGNASLGAGATTITGATTSLGSPYNHWYGGIKQQMIYTKAELNAAGITGGNISALSFELTALGSSTLTMADFTITMGHTTQSAGTTTLVTSGLTTVYSNALQGVTNGVNNYSFSTPFNWNNTDNVVVSVSWSNNNSGNSAMIPTIKVDNAGFVSTSYIYADNTTSAALFTASSNTSPGVGSTSQTQTTTNRPKVVFTYSSTQNPTWAWTPASSGLDTYTGATVVASPVTTTTYTATASNSYGCTNSSTSVVTVNECPSTLNLTAFLEGFMDPASPSVALMVPNIYTIGTSVDPNEVDTVTINLTDPAHTDINTYPTADYTAQAVLHLDGTTTVTFPAGLGGKLFYISVKHRNSIETWSKLPVYFKPATQYDFTIGQAQAYDDGYGVGPYTIAPMKVVTAGKTAFYAGDITQDGTIDGQDMNEIDNRVGFFGYDISDVNGDGATDGQDMNLVDNNSQLGLFYARPL